MSKEGAVTETMHKQEYHPKTFSRLTFYDVVPSFLNGSDTPSAYLERCLATISEREPVVKAWTALRIDAAKVEAAKSTIRYKSGKPLSPIDGMPIGVKDLILTKDLPTGLGIAGNEKAQSPIDSACVQALRQAGAIILGKLVTTELGGHHPGATTNPFDESRTPGGSSSGSGAAIGANMVPAAIGTQVGGSIMRPAGFCGNYANKPTYGAIHRGERQGYSQSCLGVHAHSLQDMWRVSIEIAKRIGGDPGHPGLYGPDHPPAGKQPSSVIVMETPGWAITDQKTIEAFELVLQQMRDQGVSVLRRADHPFIEEFERLLAEYTPATGFILAYENRWNLENLVRIFPTQLSKSTLAQLERGRQMSIEDYRVALMKRERLQAQFARLMRIGDAMISLTSPGPATPIKSDGDQRLTPLPTGNPVFNTPTSMLLVPVVAVPFLAVDGMPVGIQLFGSPHKDYDMTAYAQWMVDNLSPIAL